MFVPPGAVRIQAIAAHRILLMHERRYFLAVPEEFVSRASPVKQRGDHRQFPAIPPRGLHTNHQTAAS